MKIVILGAGALGTVLGAHLARAGEDVTLIARGNRAAYLQEHGATITGLVDFTVPVRVVTNPQQVQNADVLIVTVKTYDMASALVLRFRNNDRLCCLLSTGKVSLCQGHLSGLDLG
jgi:2-dehydropantoate 2-reductase